MLEIDPANFKTPAFKHQLEGIRFLLDNVCAGILDEMGSGKSKQLVDTACILFNAAEITDVVIACPAGVKTVWMNLRIGEVAKHAWVNGVMNEWDSSSTTIIRKPGKLTWTVVSFECLRKKQNVTRLIKALRGQKVMMIADESIRLKGHKSQQTEGATRLRYAAAQRAYIANGTPIGSSPLDLYCQMQFLSPHILRCDSFYQFRNRHAVTSRSKTKDGKSYPTIIGYQMLDVLKRQIKPYVIRRLKKHCLDLPPKIYHLREVQFTNESWTRYKEMRDQMIIFLQNDDPVVARQAIVKLIRLRQLTCGFVGGTESGRVAETSREKCDAIIDWVEDCAEQNPQAAIIVWSFFRFEQERYYRELTAKKYKVFRVYGGQDQEERERAVEAFDINRAAAVTDEPIILLGNQQSGGIGLNLTRSHQVAYSSNDYNPINRQQSEDRVDRAGQVTSPNIFDFVVTGPQGQRTIDHLILKSLKEKKDLSDWTCNEWVRELQNEQSFSLDDLAF